MMKYDKKYLEKINRWYKSSSNHSFLSRHPELERFDMPKTYYFRYLSDRQEIHWAIIHNKESGSGSPVYVYFINDWGRIFDKLEFKNVRIARRRLRSNGFDFSTNRYCPFTPPEPIYIQLSCGKKSAPYSKGNLWKRVQRDKKHFGKIENTCIKRLVEFYENSISYTYNEKMVKIPANVYKAIDESGLQNINEMVLTEKIPIENIDQKGNSVDMPKINKIIKYIVIGIFSITLLLVIGLTGLFLVTGGILFRDLKIKETDVMQQIAIESPALELYKPVLDYIDEYKSENGNYPVQLPQKYRDIVSDKFDGFEYEKNDYNGYNLRIFPKKGPIEYYQPKSLYHWRTKEKGVEDGFWDNEYYYNINENWQAIHFQHYTRYIDSFADIDICLDRGGCWDYIRHRCENHDMGYCQRGEKQCLEYNGVWQEDKKYCKFKEK